MTEIAVSSGSRALSITSMSITTDVSSRPRDSPGVTERDGRSDIDALIDERIEVRAELTGIDPGRGARRLRDGVAGDEPVRGNRFQFGHRRAVAGHDQALASLDVPQNGCGVVAELTLGDATYLSRVAGVSHCSKFVCRPSSVSSVRPRLAGST